MLLRHEKIWITGAQGQVGKAFARMLDTTELDVLLTDIDEVDITDMDAVRNYAEMNRPDVIINCAGICGPAFCEENSDLAYKVNAVGARNLSVAARSVHAEMVQISTDDIFDGRASAPYNEFSVPRPITVYGKSKLAGEEFVKTIAPKFLIIRSSWVYGEGENFVSDLLRRAETESCILAAQDQLGAPTSADEVARVIYRLLEKDAYGLYHAVCGGVCSRYEFARRILTLAGKDTQILKADNMGENGHPSYAVLDNLMLRLDEIELPVSWEEALSEYMNKNAAAGMPGGWDKTEKGRG